MRKAAGRLYPGETARLLILLLVPFLRTTVASPVHSYVDERGVLVYFTVSEKHLDIDGLPTVLPQPQLPDAQPAAAASPFDQFITRHAAASRVDPELVRAVIAAESNFDPTAVSRRGAVGLMQLIPSTARRFGVGNLFHPEQNIEGGIKYLRFLLDAFDNDLKLVLAAYNAGENVVRRFSGVPPYPETITYIRRVTGRYGDTYRPVPAAPAALPDVQEESLTGHKIYRILDPTGNVVVYTNRP